MSDRRASAAVDRLPWLDEEPAGSTGKRRSGLLRWLPLLAVIGVLVAAGSYWLGRETGSRDRAERPSVATDIGGETRGHDHEPARRPPRGRGSRRQVGAAARNRHRGLTVRRRRRRWSATAESMSAARPAEPARPKADNKQDFWPATSSAGASGRMVRIGTFASRKAAKKGWRAIMGIYPGMSRIPTAVVGSPSARDGVTYYRLQMGTTSQAHSEILCQRMRIIGQSCVVVGLQGKTGMSEHGRAYDDSQLPWLQAVEDEDEPTGLSAKQDVRRTAVRPAGDRDRRRHLLLARPPRQRRSPARPN